MLYFSYNDFSDFIENRKIDEIKKVEENTEYYKIKNAERLKENNIVKILKEKIELKNFLEEFLNFEEILENNKVFYCNQDNIKDTNIIISKIKNKEIFILINVIEEINTNISYEVFEQSVRIIDNWNKEKNINVRHPIVFPIVIYIGDKPMKNNNNKNRYTTIVDNKIEFSYNLIDINNFSINKLKCMKSKVAEEFIKLKNKYLQINQ